MKNKNNTQPLVSVVMPAYNSEKYIAEAIESVLNQTYQNFEFIIVNDCSTDKTLEIIERYAKKDPRIKFIKNEKNLGIARTRNVYLKYIKGKYIATQDSDDISLSTRIEEQVKFMENNPELGVVGAFIEIFNSKTKKLMGIREYPEKDRDLRRMIFYCSPIAQPVSMIRSSIMKEVGEYNPDYPPSEDLDLWFRIGEISKFGNIQRVLLRYRFHINSATGSKIRLMEKLANKIRWKYKKSTAYNFNFKAFSYNSLHYVSLYLIPSKIKANVFFKFRDSKQNQINH